MSATLIAVVVALVLGHVAPPLIALRRYDWYIGWLDWLAAQLDGNGAWRAWPALLLALLPLALVGLIQFGLRDAFYGLPGFVFAVAVLFYALGPRDLDLDVDAVIDAHDPDARRIAAARLFPETQQQVMEGPALVEAVFRCALWRWFGVTS